MCHAPHRTATYRVLQDSGGMRFRFFCEVSGAAICTTTPTQLQPVEAALDRAWRSEGREHFSLCHRCGRWASDLMYNPNTLQCVDCSPWKERPAFCPHCGGRLPQSNLFQLYQQNHRLCPACDTVLSDGMKYCPHCGTKIMIHEFSERKGGTGK